jgi:hypothetical protein
MYRAPFFTILFDPPGRTSFDVAWRMPLPPLLSCRSPGPASPSVRTLCCAGPSCHDVEMSRHTSMSSWSAMHLGCRFSMPGRMLCSARAWGCWPPMAGRIDLESPDQILGWPGALAPLRVLVQVEDKAGHHHHLLLLFYILTTGSMYRCPNGHGSAQPEPVWARTNNRAGPGRPTGSLCCPSTALHRPTRAGLARKARPMKEPGPAWARQVTQFKFIVSHSSHLHMHINSHSLHLHIHIMT